MYRLYYYWRCYSLRRPQYVQSMERLFYGNLDRLCTYLKVLGVLVVLFFSVPVFFDQDYTIALVYLSVGVFAGMLFFVSAHLRKRHKANKHVSHSTIYLLIAVSYSIAVFFGIYLSVIINPDRPASVYLAIIVAALYFFTTPPPFKLALTLVGWSFFLTASYLIKEPDVWLYDILNSAIAIVLSLIISWYGSMQHVVSTNKTILLEQERNVYKDQSTVDELTKLKNRRDFMQNLERYLNRPRYPDDAFCLAIIDMDYFKKYNDFYGHAKGDKCLRAIGWVLGEIGLRHNIYTARIGGEEFALLWFIGDSSPDEVLEEIHTNMKALGIPHARSDVAPHVTLSIGAYVLKCSAENDFTTVYERADEALYEAKGSGRNRTVIHDGRADSGKPVG